MKYSTKNTPIVCMMTNSTCYKGTKKFTPKGILWHSTGANNPTLKRYVQPSDGASDRKSLLKIIGENAYKNDWNHATVQAGLNFWIGKLADGTVAAVQTMPWDYRPWGCGYGCYGSLNDTHIQFEICEDALTDKDYFLTCYKEACEMTAYLCQMFGIDPKGSISHKGRTVPTITDHAGSYKLGFGTNHGDVQHWMSRYGFSMDNVRNDVEAILAGQVSTKAEKASTETKGSTNEEKIYKLLYAEIKNDYGVSGLMGNLQAESGFDPKNLQNTFNKKLNITDEEYTQLVDGGNYPDFTTDKAGYGLAQWTYWSRKQNLLNFAASKKCSIGNLEMQVEFLLSELSGSYKGVLSVLKNAKSVREASDAVLLQFEKPKDQSEKVRQTRAGYGEKIYASFHSESASASTASSLPYIVRVEISNLNIRKGPGTNYGKAGIIPVGAYTIVEESDGKGASKWGRLKSGQGWISLDYVKRG